MKKTKLGTAPATKYQLIRDGQIVGYERTIDGITETSYDNQIWVPSRIIPNDTKKVFLSFDATNLVEVYES